MGLCSTPEEAPASIPKIAMVASPTDYQLFSGDVGGHEGERKWIKEQEIDIVVRAISVEQPHRAVPITVAMACAAAAEIRGSVVEMCLGDGAARKRGGDAKGGEGKGKEIVIGHPTGKIMVGTRWEGGGEGVDRVVRSTSVFRTARRIMRGEVYWS